MADILNTGISGLIAFQRLIGTTSHNISNSSTEGFSRQRVELENRAGSAFGSGFVGSGVNVRTIGRINDEFLTNQLRSANSEAERLNMLSLLASQVDNAVADEQGSVAPMLQTFFESVNNAAANPSSIPARQVMLTDAQNLISRFHFLDSQFDASNLDANNRLTGLTQEINTISNNIADINNNIQLARAQSGQTPNDLLDQRDELLKRLGGLVSINSVQQDDDTVSVFIGNGQQLVSGNTARSLQTVVNNNDPSQIDIALVTSSGPSVITTFISGGEMGGILDFRRDILQPATNQLGRLAIVIADTFNAQHIEGQDLNGNLGTDFFTVSSPDVLTDARNTGTAVVTATIDDTSVLTASDYQLFYDGANYTLTNLNAGTNITGAGPALSMEGITVTIGAGANATDRFLIQPTRRAAGLIDTRINSASEIALALPVVASINTANTGNGTISNLDVSDVTNTNLLNTVEIRFNTPANTYDVVDTTLGANIATGVAYTAGSAITFNGVSVEVDGTPNAGDVFIVQQNTDGAADNRNGNLLADLQNNLTVENKSNYQEAYGLLVGQVGAITRQAGINASSQNLLLQSVQSRRDSLSAVNLDEEAVNLVRYQQAFQAAAQVISVSERLFDSLLNSVR